MSNKYEIEQEVENDLKWFQREFGDKEKSKELEDQWKKLKVEREKWWQDLLKECEGKTDEEIFWIKCREIGKCVKTMDEALERADDKILRHKLSKLYK